MPLRRAKSTHCVQSLVSHLQQEGLIKDPRVAHTMKLVDRGQYCETEEAYKDKPLPIGYNATISAPHMHALALEYLTPALKEGSKVLDIGSGSGYLTACLGHLVGATGTVVGLEHIPELVQLATENVQRDHPDLLSSGRVKFVVGDGRLGLKSHGNYDAIHVGAYSEEIPESLIEQLNPFGRLFIPAGSPPQIFMVQKDAFGHARITPGVFVNYVPLTSPEDQLNTR